MALRKDLEFSSQQHLEKNYVVVKDPLTKRYFRFTENQGLLLDLLKEDIDPATLAARASESLGGTITEATIEGFLKSLEDKLLLDTELVRDKLVNLKSQKREGRNFFYWKLASLNPERVFNWLLPRTRWAFTRTFHVFAWLIIATGAILNYLNWKELTVNVQELFNLHGLVLIWIITMTVVTMHEFAHGITCCHFGGKVHELGFMLIYFQPAFYCDVSDSWMFPSKKQRMWVTFAGGYFQLVVWGTCTILWRIADKDTVINQFALVVIVFAGVQTIVNFNPLIKLDGYYMLSDYLEIPNLRHKSVEYLWNRMTGRPYKDLPKREKRAQVIYGLATIVFSTSLLIYVYTALYTWATSAFAFAGLVGFVMFSTYTLRGTAVELGSGVRDIISKAEFRKYRNGGILLVALIVMFVGHWELKIPAEFKVVPRSEVTVRPETAGVVIEMLVHEGSHVAKGEVLARLRDYDKQQTVSELIGELDQKTHELTMLRAGTRAEEIDQAQKAVETKKVELANAGKNQEQRNQLAQTLALRQSQLKQDQQNLDRARALFKEELIPRNELEKAETAAAMSQSAIGETEGAIKVLTETADRDTALKSRELAQVESDLRLMQAGSRPEVIQQAEADVNRLKDQVRILNQELGKTEITSPIEGIVSTPFVERKMGQSLDAGDELCKVVDTSRVTLEMQVPEKEMEDVHPGNPVVPAFRSFPSMNLQGRVDFIAPVAQTVNGQQMVVVRSELPNDNLLLKPEMTGVANILCGDRRLADLATRRFIRWIRTEFWVLLP